jgi:hypothetical protein
MPMVPFMSPNLVYKFFVNMTFMPLYSFKNVYKLLLLELETHCLMLNCMSLLKGFFYTYPWQQLYNIWKFLFLNDIQACND